MRGTGVESVTVDAGGQRLPGLLGVPAEARGLVLFAHGSGSSRLSSRNNAVAAELRRARLGTLLFDLLTPDEAGDLTNVFNIDLLARRLSGAADWVRHDAGLGELPIGYFGASTGAAAALVAAGNDRDVFAVVSRGGRPDLVGQTLAMVASPTLLIVGQRDTEVLRLNRIALDRLTCEKSLRLVPGATHLFEEPGTLNMVAELAGEWFVSHVPSAASA